MELTAPIRVADDEGVLRPMLRLALPALGEQMLNLTIMLSDQILTGMYFSTDHIAAVGTVSYLMWLVYELFVVVAIGATALTARFIGQKQPDLANRVANQALLMGCLLAIPATILGLIYGREIILWLDLQGNAVGYASSYMGYVFWFLPLIMVETVLLACLRGVGDTRTGMWVMLMVNAVNILVSWGLVQGWGPLPELGWDGVAIGTSAALATGGSILLILFLRGQSGLQLRLPYLKPDFDLIRRLLKVGIPGGLDILMMISCQIWFLTLINGLGNLSAAAHNVAIKIEAFAFLPGTAFQVAAATLAGQYLGAKNYRKASHSILVTSIVTLSFMTLIGLVFYFGGEGLASLMVGADRAGKREVIELSARLLQIIAFSMPSLAVLMILAGALRGAGDTRWPMVINLLGFLALRIPGTYLLFGYGFGVEAAWWLMLADLTFRASLVSVRFFQGGWQRINV
ncbi:MATE family efflux transporter [Planctomycetales bacterium 10988]|nr:MATE family efflux transporter [Planctomycetales bacterium 10988]